MRRRLGGHRCVLQYLSAGLREMGLLIRRKQLERDSCEPEFRLRDHHLVDIHERIGSASMNCRQVFLQPRLEFPAQAVLGRNIRERPRQQW